MCFRFQKRDASKNRIGFLNKFQERNVGVFLRRSVKITQSIYQEKSAENFPGLSALKTLSKWIRRSQERFANKFQSKNAIRFQNMSQKKSHKESVKKCANLLTLGMKTLIQVMVLQDGVH